MAKCNICGQQKPCRCLTLNMPEGPKLPVDKIVMSIDCNVCGEKGYPNKMNGIYSKYGHKYYCKKKLCQQRFIEDAGDPPDYD